MASPPAVRFPIFLTWRLVGILVTLLLFVWAQRFRGGLALVSDDKDLLFNMAKHFNEMSGITAQIPLGSFNTMFNFTGSWMVGAAATKSLAMVGNFFPLFSVKLNKLNLPLHEDIKRAVPYSWDPAALAR